MPETNPPSSTLPDDSDINDVDPDVSEGIDDDSEIESSSKGTYTIRSYGADYTVDSLVDRMSREAFVIPTFQRRVVWSRTHASRFIESLLMGLPVPGIFLYKRPDDGRHLVIDGQQRLRTLHGFYTGSFRDAKFRLVGVREPWNGLTYDELDPADQLRLDDSIVHTIIFSQENTENVIDSIHFVFERINSGGIRLSAQETRNCLAEGKYTELVADLNKNTHWRQIYGSTSPRAKDQELITRVLAFLDRGDEYERPMATFLTRFANDINEASPKKVQKLKKSFEDSAELCWTALGRAAFRPVRALNAAVLEAVMSELARRLQQTESKPSAVQLKGAYDRLIESNEFRDGWIRSTADEEAVKKRTQEARKAFSEL